MLDATSGSEPSRAAPVGDELLVTDLEHRGPPRERGPQQVARDVDDDVHTRLHEVGNQPFVRFRAYDRARLRSRHDRDAGFETGGQGDAEQLVEHMAAERGRRRLERDPALTVAPVVDVGAAVAFHRDAAQRHTLSLQQIGNHAARLPADGRAQHRSSAECARHAGHPVTLASRMEVHLEPALGVLFQFDEQDQCGREDRKVGSVSHAGPLPGSAS